MARIDEIKAATAINVEAERKVAQLNDEIQALARTLKIKDQTIQETNVKIELMERRMETVKKQADAITDLENELSKARKQEHAYEEAMEQLQADLDALEQDNAKLKALANNPERQGEHATYGFVGRRVLRQCDSFHNSGCRSRERSYRGQLGDFVSPGAGTCFRLKRDCDDGLT